MTSKMGYSLFIALTLLLPTVASAQSCQNYGTQNGSVCACPPGFGGNTCSQPSCGGNLFQGLNRTLVPAPLNNSTFPNTTSAGCSCQAGWIGTGCNVCQTTNACQIAYAAATGTNGTSASSVASSGQTGQNDTMVCNTKPQVYAAGEMSCDVIVRPFLLFLNQKCLKHYLPMSEPYNSKNIPPRYYSQHPSHSPTLPYSHSKCDRFRLKRHHVCSTLVWRY